MFMNDVYLLTGGNLGNRKAQLELACAAIGASVGVVKRASRLYETAPWGLAGQPAFLNQVLWVQTVLSGPEVLHEALRIEAQMGRQRQQRYAARTIDIDVLLFNHDVIDLPELVVPHPAMALRRFVLAPLAELAGQYRHPVLNLTIAQLLQHCPDPLEVAVFF
jgi:2-amino-4-hydroxy-6-hydroxymethyldihydropteridine diphosphokinase